MAKLKTSKKVLEECQRDGFLKPQEEIDLRKIRTMVEMALTDLRVVRDWCKNTPDQRFAASTVFKLHYDVFRELVDAFIRFDRIKSLNHHCLFAHLIERHPELELDWGLLEEIRTKRNGIQYYGTPITYEEWKRLEIPLNLYINTMKQEIEEKLRKTPIPSAKNDKER